MKSFREFYTEGDFFRMEVNFLPENDEEENDLFDGLVTETRNGRQYSLEAVYLLRYPKHVGPLFRPRFSVNAHPNLSPLIVLQETDYFLSIVKKLIQQ